MPPARASAHAPLLLLSPGRAIVRVAWPMVVLGLLRTLYFLTDSYWVGRLGPAPLAALGGAAFAFWIVNVLSELAGTGVQALVARHTGAGRLDRIAPSLAQGLWLGGLVSFGLAALAVGAPLYFDLLGIPRSSPEHALGGEYLRALLWGSPALTAQAVISSVFRGLGRTRPALAINALTAVLNAIVDPLLIWGVGPFPELGIAGAAWATSLASGIGALVGLWLLAELGYPLRFAPPRLERLRLLLRIGLPHATGSTGFALVYVILGRLINQFGPEQLGGLGVGHRLEGLAFAVCVGMSAGAATLVGQYLGAGDPAGAARAAHRAAQLAAALMLPFGVGLWLGADWLLGIFSADPLTIAAGALYIRIQVLALVFMALEVVYEGAFAGSGDTLAAFAIGALLTALRIPLAWWLALEQGFGIAGVWVAIASTTTLKGITMWAWFRRGRWASALADRELDEGA